MREMIESTSKWDLLRMCGEKFELDTLVETGGYHGGCMAYLKDDFKRLVTIEYGDSLFKDIYDLDIPNVLCLPGDSGRVLRQFLLFYAEPALFFLDAHPSGLDTAVWEGECIWERELRAILDRGCPFDVVIVDDVDNPGIEKERVTAVVHEYQGWEVRVKGEWPECMAIVTAEGRFGEGSAA